MAIMTSINGVIFIALDEENMERIQSFDPFEARLVDIPIALPMSVVIAYAKKEEYEAIKAMTPVELQNHFYRGYRFTDTDKQRETEGYKPI